MKRTFTDENWIEQPLFIVERPDTDMVICRVHGQWCPNAFYDPAEQAEMLMDQGFLDCPFCMVEIVGIER